MVKSQKSKTTKGKSARSKSSKRSSESRKERSKAALEAAKKRHAAKIRKTYQDGIARLQAAINQDTTESRKINDKLAELAVDSSKKARQQAVEAAAERKEILKRLEKNKELAESIEEKIELAAADKARKEMEKMDVDETGENETTSDEDSSESGSESDESQSSGSESSSASESSSSSATEAKKRKKKGKGEKKNKKKKGKGEKGKIKLTSARAKDTTTFVKFGSGGDDPLGLGEMGIAVKTTKGKDKPKEKKKQAEREVDERTRAIDKLLEGIEGPPEPEEERAEEGEEDNMDGSEAEGRAQVATEMATRSEDSELSGSEEAVQGEDSEKKHHIMADENDENESEGSQEETGKVPKGEEAEERKPSGEPIPKSKWKGYIYVPIKEETEETEQQLPKADEMTGRTTQVDNEIDEIGSIPRKLMEAFAEGRHPMHTELATENGVLEHPVYEKSDKSIPLDEGIAAIKRHYSLMKSNWPDVAKFWKSFWNNLYHSKVISKNEWPVLRELAIETIQRCIPNPKAGARLVPDPNDEKALMRAEMRVNVGYVDRLDALENRVERSGASMGSSASLSNGKTDGRKDGGQRGSGEETKARAQDAKSMAQTSTSKRMPKGTGRFSMERPSAGHSTRPKDVRRAVVQMESTYARDAYQPATVPNHASADKTDTNGRQPEPVTPLQAKKWEEALKYLDILEEHATLIDGLKNGFNMQCQLAIDETRVYPHLRSAVEHPKVIEDHIEKEVAANRYDGPHTREEVEKRLGAFVANPLGTVDKASGRGKRVIEHLSFAYEDEQQSVNAQTNIENLGTNWGGLAEMIELIVTSPDGAQGATIDWEAAFRNCPIRPEDWRYGVVEWNGKFWIDKAAKFGAKSSVGIFELPNRAFVEICTRKELGTIIYWVDDLMIRRLPVRRDGEEWIYGMGIAKILELGEELGIPFPPDKVHDFANITTYVGFDWHWQERAVSVSESKRKKNLALVQEVLEEGRKTSGERLQTNAHESFMGDGSENGPTEPALEVYQVEHAGEGEVRPQMVEGNAREAGDKDSAMYTTRTKLQVPDLHRRVDGWGLGVVIDDEYDKFRLESDWRTREGDGAEREIGWAEFAAVELAVEFILQRPEAERTHIEICTDNQGVIGGWKKRLSRNEAQNEVLGRILHRLVRAEAYLTLTYVRSEENPADGPSRGVEPPGYTQRKLGRFPRSLVGYVRRA
ncbi:SubName: Full=Reverse transcriptase domain protein, putative {ECO:0000313/EMBL:EUC58599.1}; Flags: Fragment [Serendipita indica DSM 11827]|nr:SubName: Full=Reverse transcriptase domain protein, putative {ECO:0000313/EMBL:EUC58599.1}; Flags: Fragment [Serendipita indica DSM 11827]